MTPTRLDAHVPPCHAARNTMREPPMDHWSRRQFVQGAGVAGLGLLAGCGRLPGQAQPPAKVYRIGVLFSGRSGPQPTNQIAAFREGLRDLGYVEDQNLALEIRIAEGQDDRLRALVADLLAVQLGGILAWATPAVLALREATQTVPIIMPISGDPVGTGLVDSLAHPGGNVTGLSIVAPVLNAKRVELLKETSPALSHVAYLWNPDNPTSALDWRQVQNAAADLGVRLESAEVRSLDSVEVTLETATRQSVEAIVVSPDPVWANQQGQITALAAKHHLPAMYPAREFADAGGLMAYGPSVLDSFRRAGNYVHRI